jgi:hypothetical protein
LTDQNDIPEGEEYSFIRSIAEQYNIKVRFHPLGEDIRGYKMEDEIVLNSQNPIERNNWTLCHELGHIILRHSAEPTEEEEREADSFAGETMLPAKDFARDAKGFDLPRLKELYPHASYEVLARRCLQFYPGCMTIFDQEELTLRLGSEGFAFNAVPTPNEMKVMKQCYRMKDGYSLNNENIYIQGFYIDQGRDVVRVILMAEAME